MCPLWPCHLILLYLMMLWPLWLVCSGAVWKGTFHPSKVNALVEDTTQEIVFESASDLRSLKTIEVISSDCQIAEPEKNQTLHFNTSSSRGNISFFLSGRFLGHTKVKLRASDENKRVIAETEDLPVSVIRPKRVIDNVFIISVALLVGLNYINMGCTIDLDVVKSTVRKPIGPLVGLASQFIFMPLVSFGLSYAIFTSPNMRLGLFTVGCSPGGGASNMWTYLLGGNLNLSITCTFISNIVAFAMMPAWLFSLGRVIFDASNINIPYTNIVTSLVALVIPVGIGVLIQRYLPKATKFSRRILGPCSAFMIVFIVIFGVVTNLFMFSLFSWRIAVGGLCVPWLGYLFGALFARLFKFPFEDIIAIAVETGIQNTGIAIILLRFSLPQPDADLTSVIPVASAMMMPVPLLLVMLFLRLRSRWQKGSSYEICKESSSGESSPESGVTREPSKSQLSTHNGTSSPTTNGTSSPTTNGTNKY